jgi:hypothetical protein
MKEAIKHFALLLALKKSKTLAIIRYARVKNLYVARRGIEPLLPG